MLIRTALLLGLCTALSLPVLAQEMPEWAKPTDTLPSEEPTDRGPGLPDDPSPVPIDGLALLALAGAGYAVRRLRR